MCTAMMTTSQSDNIFFGRTMDYSYPLDPEFFLVPRECKWSLHSGSHKITQRYSVLGIGHSLLHQIQIVGFKNPVTDSVVPLHWIIGDSSGRCMTIEKTQDGLHILENSIGILSNSPDFFPPSRFVRRVYLKSHTFFPEQPSEALSACFHIMENLSIPKGVVMAQRETSDYTQYTAFI